MRIASNRSHRAAIPVARVVAPRAATPERIAPISVASYSKSTPSEWYQPGGRPIFLADVLDEHGPSPMSAGFALYAKGASNDWTVAYDEVLVVTKGVFSVIVEGKATTAQAGEIIFLPKGTKLTYRAEEAAEVVYVSYPHWAQATRASAHAKALDEYKAVPASAIEAASR